MAEIRKHPKSKYWSARFYDSSGVRHTRSTKTTNRREAQRIADAFEEASRKKRTAKQVRDVISEFHKAITGEDLASQSFRAFTESWIIPKTPEVKPSTITFYRTAIAKFITFLGSKADAEITEITSDDIVRFRNLESKTLSVKTVNHDLKALKMILTGARQDRVLSESPCEFVKTTKGALKKKRTPFTIPQLQAVLAVADDEWKSLIRFGLYTGQRIGDLASLTWRSVDLIKKQIRLTQQKTGKAVIIPLTGQMVTQSETMPNSDSPDTPIHPKAYAAWERTGKTATLSNQFADLLAQAGLREKKAHRKSATEPGRGVGSSQGGLSFHCLRTTMITMGAELGIPKEVIMAIAGHDSEEMSLHYTNIGTDALERAITAFPVI